MDIAAGITHAFYWNGNELTDLHYDIENYYNMVFSFSWATAINNNDQVVAWARDTSNNFKACIWHSGNITDLGTLGDVASWAYDIKDSGLVVGHSTKSGGRAYGYLWYDGYMVDMGTVGDGVGSNIFSVNNKSEAVGLYATPTYDYYASIWTAAQGMLDLNDLIDPVPGLVLERALDINDDGVIVGLAYLDGIKKAFILIPRSNPPQANAGPDLDILSSNVEYTTIQGTATDVDESDILEYRWLEGGVALVDWTLVNENGGCPLDLSTRFYDKGTHTLTLQVRDSNDADLVFDNMVLNVLNTSPEADAGPERSVLSSEVNVSTIIGYASDFDASDTLLCQWFCPELDSTLLPWTPVSAAGECPLPLSGIDLSRQDYTLVLKITDGFVTESVTDDMTLRVLDTPSAVNAGPDLEEYSENVSETTIIGTATDYDNSDDLICRWLEGTTVLVD